MPGRPVSAPSTDVYVIALLGESPAVITELLWHLVVVDGLRVAGLEIWTTAGSLGAGTTTGFLARAPRMFAALRDAVGPLAVQIPAWVAHDATSSPQAPLALDQVQVFVAELDGRLLPDTSTSVQAAAFSAWAHQRAGRVILDNPLRVVGSVAGGRKAMSTLLHSAFLLHARGTDRLCHVLLHPSLEGGLREEGKLSSYVCPVEVSHGVPVAQQVSVLDVPFFSVSDFVAIRDRRPARVLLDSAREALAAQRATASRTVRFDREGARVTLSFAPDVPFRPKTALLYAVLLGLGSATPTRVARETNRLLPEGVRRVALDAEPTLRRLEAELECRIGADTALAGFVPRRLPSGSWTLAGHPDFDVGELQPAAVLAALF